jgi:hypothetical protein
MAFLVSTALADPPVGDPPFYKYPFLFDPHFDVPDDSYLALGPNQPNPPRGTTYPDGKWYSAYWGHLSPESYARVEDGMARLRTVSIDHSPWVYGGTMVDQGRASHLAVQVGHFKGSNTTYQEANPTPRIIFDYGETIPGNTLWFDVKARILDRAKMDYLNPEAQANLGFNFQFQPEYRDGSGNVILEDYDNPDFSAGSGVFPKVVNFDIFLSNHHYSAILGEYDEAVGAEHRHISSGIIADADLHVQRVEGYMPNIDAWYTFHIDLGNDINRALQMTEDHYYSLYGDPYPPHGWYTLNRLILRNIQLYTEASGALIEAEVDTAIIYTPNILYLSSMDGGTTNPAPGTKYYPYGTPVTVTAIPYSEWHFTHWILDGNYNYDNPITVTMNSHHSLRAYFLDGGGPGGGCPYVSSWNGTHYMLDNNLIPAAEYSNGTDVTDYYMLQQPPIRSDGKYSLLIWDLDKHSFIDHAQLVAVDHKSNVNIAVSPYGEVLTYKNPAPLTSAVSKNGTDVLSELIQEDGQSYQGCYGDSIQLDFDGVDIQNGAKLVVTSDYCPFPPCEIKKCPTYIQVLNSTGDWQTVATIHTRIYWAVDIVDLSSCLPDANGELKVRVSFTGEDKIDYIGLDTTKQGKIEISYANLATANHTRLGDVKELLRTSDDTRVELLPGEQFTLQFTLPQATEERREFIIILEGHYFA